MTNESDEVRPPRATNGDILRDLQKDVQDLGRAVAGLSPQVSQVLEVSRQMQASLNHVTQRIESSEQESIRVRSRIEVLEGRPIAMGPEKQGEILSLIRQLDGDIDVLKQNDRETRNRVNVIKTTPADFTRTEVEDIKRWLPVIKGRGVSEALSTEEITDFREMRQERQERSESRVRRLSTLESALIGLIFGGGGVAAVLEIVRTFGGA